MKKSKVLRRKLFKLSNQDLNKKKLINWARKKMKKNKINY